MTARLWALMASAVIVGSAACLGWWSLGADRSDEASASESCIEKFSGAAGRRDAAEAMRTGDARLLYRVDFYPEGAEAHIPGIETVGISGEGWTPPADLSELVGRFNGDKQWYWIGVLAPKPSPWSRPGAQLTPQLAKCRKAELIYLEAYNRSIPPEKVPRRPAPTPDPKFAVSGGMPPIDEKAKERP